MTQSEKLRAALEALFDEGANFADYDEGKMNAKQPDGYDHRNVDTREVRRRAVDRALLAVAPVPDGYPTLTQSVDGVIERIELPLPTDPDIHLPIPPGWEPVELPVTAKAGDDFAIAFTAGAPILLRRKGTE
jgi:hypothetical protein